MREISLGTTMWTALQSTWWSFGSRQPSPSTTNRQTPSSPCSRTWMTMTNSSWFMLHYTRTDCWVVSLEQLRSPQQPLVWRAPPAVCSGQVVSLNSGLAAAGWSNNFHKAVQSASRPNEMWQDNWFEMVLNSQRLPSNQTDCHWQYAPDARDRHTTGRGEHPHPVAQPTANETGTVCETAGLCPASSCPCAAPKEAKVLPDEPMQAQEKHKYQLPKSTAGQGQPRQRPSSTHLPRLIMPKGPTKRTSVTVSPAPLPFLAPHLVSTAGVLQWVLPVAATQGPPTPPDKPSIRPQKKLRPPWRGHIDVWKRPINAKSVGSSAHSSNWPQPVPWEGLLSWFRIPVTRSVAVQDEK